jgi:hypothetical protein
MSYIETNPSCPTKKRKKGKERKGKKEKKLPSSLSCSFIKEKTNIRKLRMRIDKG